MKHYATKEGTARYRDRSKNMLPSDHFRESQGLWMSSIGFGTYLGNYDESTDIRYRDAVLRAVELGCNSIDTAINYRFQRSERSIGAALQVLFNDGKISRDELIIATKGGYIPFDGAPPKDMNTYFIETFMKPGIASSEDIVSGSHCMTPRYIENQLECSLRNLGLECIDIYYLHNPEEQLQEVSGEDHHFKVIQLPFNLAMPEALILKNQRVDGEMTSILEASWRLGVTVIGSSSLLQSQLSKNLPDFIGVCLKGLETDAQRAIQFVRSTPGISSALVGMSKINHIEENMKVAKIPPASIEDFVKLFASEEE